MGVAFSTSLPRMMLFTNASSGVYAFDRCPVSTLTIRKRLFSYKLRLWSVFGPHVAVLGLLWAPFFLWSVLIPGCLVVHHSQAGSDQSCVSPSTWGILFWCRDRDLTDSAPLLERRILWRTPSLGGDASFFRLASDPEDYFKVVPLFLGGPSHRSVCS